MTRVRFDYRVRVKARSGGPLFDELLHLRKELELPAVPDREDRVEVPPLDRRMSIAEITWPTREDEPVIVDLGWGAIAEERWVELEERFADEGWTVGGLNGRRLD